MWEISERLENGLDFCNLRPVAAEFNNNSKTIGYGPTIEIVEETTSRPLRSLLPDRASDGFCRARLFERTH